MLLLSSGVCGAKTPQKLLSTILFLYFACLLPSIAFGSLNDKNTEGKISNKNWHNLNDDKSLYINDFVDTIIWMNWIDVEKVILGQGVGGILFALFGGQPLLILLTTAPLALYTRSKNICIKSNRFFDRVSCILLAYLSVIWFHFLTAVFQISRLFDVHFFALFGCVGLWNSFFLICYSVLGASKIMKWCTR